MNETYTKLRDFAQKRLDDSCENDCNNDIRYWVGYLVGLNALYKELYRTEEALEKQIPKKPVEVRNEIVCPTCKTLVGSSPYCRYCGQALDHSGTDDYFR